MEKGGLLAEVQIQMGKQKQIEPIETKPRYLYLDYKNVTTVIALCGKTPR
jgi:hypothetical protein